MRAADAATLGGDARARIRSAVPALEYRLARIRPAIVVVTLAALQAVGVLALALSAQHNGWLYFSGGDATEYWSQEWALSQGLIPNAVLGYGVPLLFAWVPWLTGVNPLSGLPSIVLVQVLVLGPLAVACIYGLAARIAGRCFAAFATALWAVVPFAAIPLFRPDYHERYVDQFLPQALGLVNMGDFPSLVVVVAAAYFAFRAIDLGNGNDAIMTGLLTGLAVGVKPANAVLLPAAVLALLLARRWRGVLYYGAAVLPAVLTLALWKWRGLGHLPLLTVPETRQAAGLVPHAGTYLDFSWSHLSYNLGQLREFFWSRLLCEFVVVAGGWALLRKAPAKATYILTWFAAYFVFKGGSEAADIRTGSYFRLVTPGFPAFALLLAGIVLLVPGWGRRSRTDRLPDTPPRPTRALILAATFLAAVPLAAVAAASPAPIDKLGRLPLAKTDSPITGALHVRAVPIPDGVELRWDSMDAGGAQVFYVVFRESTYGTGCGYTGTGGEVCTVTTPLLARTGITRLDETPLPGHYLYRVGVAASWRRNQADYGDIILLSNPIVVDVFCTTAKCERDAAKHPQVIPTP